MHIYRKLSAGRRPVNLLVDTALLDQARRLKVNVSEVLEVALRRHVKRLKLEHWQVHSRAAVLAYNRKVQRHAEFCEWLSPLNRKP